MKVWELVENRCNKNSNSKGFDFVYKNSFEYPSPTKWLDWKDASKPKWLLDTKEVKFKQG